MKKTAKVHLQEILSKKGSPLEKIFSLYHAQQSLVEAFEKELPHLYRNQIKFLFYKNGIMTLGVNNSAMMSRLTYVREELSISFKKNPVFAGLREIKLKMSY